MKRKSANSVFGWLPLLKIPMGLGIMLGSWLGNTALVGAQATPTATPCPESALAQVVRYRVVAGDTLSSIATRYGLLPATVQRFNPGVLERPPVGQDIKVPPFNGTLETAASGQTWQTLAERYGIQADVLFEVNGCVATVPRQVFIPGAHQRLPQVTATPQNPILVGYPLPADAAVVLSYGWQPHPTQDEMVFNSGIALSAKPATQVLAVADGTVAFAGQQGNYGNLVVVNHRDGLQTRYGNLGEISVSVGQSVHLGDALGTVKGIDADPESFLYFEVRTNSELGWVAQDPRQYVPALKL